MGALRPTWRPAVPNPISDEALPTSGSRMIVLGRRDLWCEPWPPLDDYARVSVNMPAEVDEIEVKYLAVSINYMYLTWDSAYYGYLTIAVKKGSSTYYLIYRYNPNPGDSYGPFADSGWLSNNTVFKGVAGYTVQLEVLLHTFGDNLYKSWVYVDDVKVYITFDCHEGEAQPLKAKTPKGLPLAPSTARPERCARCKP